MSDRIIVMNKGVIEQVGTPKEVYATPASQFVADFIGAANIVPGTIVTLNEGVAEVTCLNTLFRVKTKASFAARRYGQVDYSPEKPRLSRQENIPAEIVSSVFMGSYQDYVIHSDGQVLLIVDPDPANHETFSDGEQAFLSIAPNSLHLVR